MSSRFIQPEGIDAEILRRHLGNIEESEAFMDVEHQRRLLRFLVEQRLTGRQDQIKASEIVLANMVRERAEPNQPCGEVLFPDEQSVRTHIGRLRKTLLAYYHYERPREPLRIDIPKKKYLATLSWSSESSPPPPPKVDQALQEIGVQSALESKTQKPLGPPVLAALLNVPPRNRFFTGRDSYLEQLREALVKNDGLPVAISGLGGVGKTQTAIQYAYRYRDRYETVLWCGVDSRESLMSGFAALAKRLNPPQKDASDLNVVVDGVRDWLASHSGWLLILDNLEDPAVIRPFFNVFVNGHVVITTRMRGTGDLAEASELQKMKPEEGALFLLRRTRTISKDHPLDAASDTDRELARRLSEEVDGLALALDQAGAYIEETPSTLSEYIALYRAEGARLRSRRGDWAADHAPVTNTFALSFASVAKYSPAAADLLRASTFLAPDAIPEELFIQGGNKLGEVLAATCADTYAWTKAIAEAGRFSLIHRNTVQRTLEMHRLVQDALRDEIDAPVRCLWVGRVVQALNATFPDPEFQNWQECEQLLPHARVAARHVADYGLDSVDAAGLLAWTGTYLRGRAQYAEAEPFLNRALAIVEKTLGPDDTRTTTCLTRLAGLYYCQGRYKEAEPLLKRACHNDENRDADETAGAIDTLAAIYDKQGRYGEAETIYQNALDIKEKALGPNHPHVATCLNNLAMVYQGQDRYEEAEPLLKRAIRIRQITLGPDHPDTAQAINNLAVLYFHKGRYAEAQTLVQGALGVYERTLGPDHPDTAQALNDLAVLYDKQGRYGEAETIYQNALDIKEKALGPNHPSLAVTLWNLALLYETQGRYGEAETLARRSCHIYEEALGPTHKQTLKSHARLLRMVRQDEAANFEC